MVHRERHASICNKEARRVNFLCACSGYCACPALRGGFRFSQKHCHSRKESLVIKQHAGNEVQVLVWIIHPRQFSPTSNKITAQPSHPHEGLVPHPPGRTQSKWQIQSLRCRKVEAGRAPGDVPSMIASELPTQRQCLDVRQHSFLH